jgi:hypothetical protein
MGDLLIFKQKKVIPVKKKNKSQLMLEYLSDRIAFLYKEQHNIKGNPALELKFISACNQINKIRVKTLTDKELEQYIHSTEMLKNIIETEQKKERLSKFQLIKCS